MAAHCGFHCASESCGCRWAGCHWAAWMSPPLETPNLTSPPEIPESLLGPIIETSSLLCKNSPCSALTRTLSVNCAKQQSRCLKATSYYLCYHMHEMTTHTVVKVAVHRLLAQEHQTELQTDKSRSVLSTAAHKKQRAVHDRRSGADVMGGGGAPAGWRALISSAPEAGPRPPMVCGLIGRIHLN